jgi:hypothetical protein
MDSKTATVKEEFGRLGFVSFLGIGGPEQLYQRARLVADELMERQDRHLCFHLAEYPGAEAPCLQAC